MSTLTPNIGWVFYKDYYQKLKPALKEADGLKKIKELKLGLEDKNKTITNQLLTNHASSSFAVGSLANCKFTACTQYPGLMAGLGTQHSIGHEEEVKLGFSFDHTTGLPYLPASSVKGILRSYFPSRLREAASGLRENSPERKALEHKAGRLYELMTQFLLPKAAFEGRLSEADLQKLEEQIFNGILPQPTAEGATHQSLYERDIFFDAYPFATKYEGNGKGDKGRFLGLGAITPHGKNPLKNPIPLRFLKVLPGVHFEFQFRLHDAVIAGQQFNTFHKFQLFQTIITYFGIGAKTNVGYGRMGKVG